MVSCFAEERKAGLQARRALGGGERSMLVMIQVPFNLGISTPSFLPWTRPNARAAAATVSFHLSLRLQYNFAGPGKFGYPASPVRKHRNKTGG